MIRRPRLLSRIGVRSPPHRRRAAIDRSRAQPKDFVPADHRRLVCYTYSISGVSYETAQDITGLAQRAGLERLAAGQPASVKYDPVNPSNSILVADDWLGVH